MESHRDPRVERRIQAQRIFASASVEIGWLDLPLDDPSFRRSGVPGRHLLVFPRSNVTIRHDDGGRVVADLNTVTFYAPDDGYRRSSRDRRGDRCAWFALDPEVLAELVAEHEPPERRVAGRLVAARAARSDAAAFLAERRLIHRLRAGEALDPLAVEETTIELFRRQLRAAYGSARTPAHGPPGDRRAHRRLTDRTRELLRERFAEADSLEEIGRAVGASPYHLCRLFRRSHGTTIHRYRTELRLRAAADLALHRRWRLADVAAEVGFSSHAHLTATFRRAFGVVPSRALTLGRPRQVVSPRPGGA